MAKIERRASDIYDRNLASLAVGEVFASQALCSVDIKFNENNLYVKVFLLSDEYDRVQKKTFTKWVNTHLMKVSEAVRVR